MNHLFRELAPVSEAAWSQIDEEARTRLQTYLQGRRLVDFSGPHGWAHSAVNLGRLQPLSSTPGPGAGAPSEAASRVVLPLVELRQPFQLSRQALDGAERGDQGFDLDALDEAARTIATAETIAVYHGWPAAGIRGIAEASPHDAIRVASPGGPRGQWAQAFAEAVTRAVATLALAGVGGPYGLALGDAAWVAVQERTESGATLTEHLGSILAGGPIVWAPGVELAVVVSQRGGDLVFVSGQDLSIGFRSATAETVALYLEESFTLRIDDETVAVALVS
ncbi:MAG: family 1 encapsulin nanocompartment shell protein [Candidatus Dormibacteraceae bacterium]